MKQHQHIFAARLVAYLFHVDLETTVHSFDLYDTWTDVIVKRWGITESMESIDTMEQFYKSLNCDLGMDEVHAMLADYLDYSTSMRWAIEDEEVTTCAK